jgi:pimeloyl-ACP methyl ester carboxylesterase
MFSTREMNIEGHKIVAQCFNENKAGIPAIFIHGVTTSINFWHYVQIPLIKENFRWYSLSLPGHFPATLPTDFTKDKLTADMITHILTTAIRELVADQPAILVGHSTGGFSVLSIAAYAPEIAHRVISIAGFAHGKWTGVLAILQWLARHGKITEALFKTDLKILVSSRIIYKMAIFLFAYDWKALYTHPDLEKILDLLYPVAKNLDVNAMLYYFNRMPEIDISDRLPHITAPTLVLTGSNDPIVPPSQSHLIAGRVPNCELVILEGAGHLLMAERPLQFNDAITNWLEKVA